MQLRLQDTLDVDSDRKEYVHMATQAVEVATKRKGLGLRERLDVGSGFTPYFLVLPTIIVIVAVGGFSIVNCLWQSLQTNRLSPSSSFFGLQHHSRDLTSIE